MSNYFENQGGFSAASSFIDEEGNFQQKQWIQGLVQDGKVKDHLTLQDSWSAEIPENCNQMWSYDRGYSHMQFAYGGAQMTDDVAFAYNTQRAKNRANLEAEIERDKMKERTAVTHGFTANGFSRAKMFSDGCQMYHSIASGCIVGAKRWKVEEAEFVSLAIQKMTGRERKTVWTPVFSISDLEKESFVEQLLSRYFNPVDSRAYSKVSIKDIRSRIFECVASVPIEQLPKKLVGVRLMANCLISMARSILWEIGCLVSCVG